MDRRERLTRFARKEARGIEIAPWHSPLAPRREGYDCLVLDRLDQDALVRRAQGDPNLTPEQCASIETVDLIGPADKVDTLVEARGSLGTFDYVLSSHNFEHLPDPVAFLVACGRVLRPGGVLSMAIPDRRCCFDCFRPSSTTADLLEAAFARRQQPSAKQVFLQESLRARLVKGSEELSSFSLEDDPSGLAPLRTLRPAYQAWVEAERGPRTGYEDTHCWAFTPASFELVVRDLRYLRAIPLEVREVSPVMGNEFHVHLVKPDEATASPLDEEAFWAERTRLLHRALGEAGLGQSSRRAEAPAPHRSLEARLAELEAEVRRFRDSRSWQLTRPLRIAAALGRRLVGRT